MKIDLKTVEVILEKHRLGDDHEFQICRAFYYFHELMKYIVIEQGSRHDSDRGLSCKESMVALLRNLA